MKNENYEIDKKDQAILDVLAVDGRISVASLAERVGLSKTPCQLRMKKLQEQGFITGFRANINYKKIGLSHVAFVEVKLSDTRANALEKFNEAVRAIPEVVMCHMIAGAFDYLLKVRTSNIDEYRSVLGEKLSALPFVNSTSTHVSMEAVQE